MNYKVNPSKVAVDLEYEWQPMTTCPLHTKVQLLTIGGIALYGTFDGKDQFYVGWAPVPRRPAGTVLVPVQRAAK